MRSRTVLTPGQMKDLASALTQQIPSDLASDDADHWIKHKGELGPQLAFLRRQPAATVATGWPNQLIARDTALHQRFFGQTSDLKPQCATLAKFGEDRARELAKKYGLTLICWPKKRFTQDAQSPGWKVRPGNWFWEQLAAGQIKRRNAAGDLEVIREIAYEGAVLVVDTRCKPAYNNGKQMFAKDADFLGQPIESLRQQGKIVSYEPRQSRFNISSLEWDDHLRSALSARPEFAGITWYLEDPIQMNVIPQLYRQMPRRNDGKTDTWVWLEWFFGDASRRLSGGGSDYGGLAGVCWLSADDHWGDRAVRPVGVLAP